MCEECGEVLCTDCLESQSTKYTVCNECHHNLGVQTPGESFEQCPECESEDLGNGRRVEEVCPTCRSSMVISIEEKRRSLAQNLRQAIMSIHHGHTKLREFNNELVSAKRLLVSLRMANFLHYKWLEDRLEALQKEIEAVKSRIMNQAELVSKRFAAETKGLMDYPGWSSSQFPFIEGVTNRVISIGEQYRMNVEDSLSNAHKELTELHRQLDGLHYYKKHFAGFYEVCELSVSELPVCAFPDIKVAGSDFLRHDRAQGTLYVTNKRIVFLAETGIVRKKMEVIFDFPIMYINTLEEDGRIRKKLVIHLKQGDLKIACSEQTLRVLPDYLEIAKKFDRYVQSDMQRVRKIEQQNVNISDVRIKIESLVYALLSSKNPIGVRHPESGYRDERSPYYGEPVGGLIREDMYRREDSFRDELKHRLSDRWQRPPTQSYNGSSDPYKLRQDFVALQEALEETIQMMRNRRIVPEDFIRRYRGLMRDTYLARKQLESTKRDSSGHRW